MNEVQRLGHSIRKARPIRKAVMIFMVIMAMGMGLALGTLAWYGLNDAWWLVLVMVACVALFKITSMWCLNDSRKHPHDKA